MKRSAIFVKFCKSIQRTNKLAIYTMLVVCCIMVASGCRSSKEVTASREVVSLKSEREFFAAFQEQSFQYQTFSARVQFEITLTSGKETSSRAQLKIQKNQRLQISIQPLLGIEAFRAELTPDSIKVVDRVNRRFLLESFDKIEDVAEIDFNFYNVQALFTNQLFLPGEITLSENQFNRFRWEQTGTGYLLRTEDRAGLHYAFTADSNEKLSATEIRDMSTQYNLTCSYENFRSVNQQLFPMNIFLRLLTVNNAQGSLSLNFSRVEVDAPLDMTFPIPANYQQVSLQQILNSIEQL